MRCCNKRVITFGTFDLFHVGHLNILRRAKEYGSHLIVGVSSDQLNFSKKGFYPTITQDERAEIVEAVKYVDEVFFEESLELKGHYITQFKADTLVMGDDWAGRFDVFRELCQVVYLPRTEGVSTTEIKQTLARPSVIQPPVAKPVIPGYAP